MIDDYAERARALVGTRFRPQGRDSNGLDCVGVAIVTYGVPADIIRRDYRLRGDHAVEVRTYLDKHFRRVPPKQLRPGDLMLMEVGVDQLHLGVCTPAGFVHAHAGLRRVVETPGSTEWRVVGVYRKRKG